MPDTDEDFFRDLMTRSTADLFASPAATAAALRRQRQRRLRTRVLAVTGTAAAAGIAAGTVLTTHSGTSAPGGGSAAATGASGAGTAQSGTASPGTARLTAAQQTLDSLSSASAATARPSGRYVIMAEKVSGATPGAGGGSEAGQVTSVIDTVTGGGVTYRDITAGGSNGEAAPSAKKTDAAGSSPTVQKLDAMPTGTSALRAALLTQSDPYLKQDEVKTGHSGPSADADIVFENATALLWEPDLSPALRSALYQVLATTPGVAVNPHATDGAGRPAIEISRTDTIDKARLETFEDPKTGATLQTVWHEADGEVNQDLYLTTTYADAIPADPYQG